MPYTVNHIQRLHADRHTYTLLKDTPSHTLTVITTVCIMERHMIVLHTLSPNRNTQRDTHIYTEGPSFSNAHRYTGISDTETYWSQSHTNTDAHSHPYLSRDTHPLSQPPPVPGPWRGKTAPDPSPPRGDRFCPAQRDHKEVTGPLVAMQGRDRGQEQHPCCSGS